MIIFGDLGLNLVVSIYKKWTFTEGSYCILSNISGYGHWPRLLVWLCARLIKLLIGSCRDSQIRAGGRCYGRWQRLCIPRSTSSSQFLSSSSSSRSSSFFYSCRDSQIRGRGGVAREGGRGHAGEDHIKIIIIIITSFIIITTMYSQIRGWGMLLGRFGRGHARSY